MNNQNLGKDILKNKLKNLAIIFAACLVLWLVNHFFVKSETLEQLSYLVAIFYTVYSLILVSIMSIQAKSNSKK